MHGLMVRGCLKAWRLLIVTLALLCTSNYHNSYTTGKVYPEVCEI